MIYISVLAGREQLFVAGVDGRGAAQLTSDDAEHEDPAWSPDGTRIAFVFVKGGREVVPVMRVDGSGVEALTPTDVRAIHPSWSPDGTRLVYCDDDDLAPRKNPAAIHVIDLLTHLSEVFVANADGPDARNLTNHPAFDGWPAWSPDGSHIAFASTAMPTTRSS